MTVADQLTRQDPAPTRPWRSALEQIEAELAWLALRLRVAVERGRRRRALGPPDSYRGLYVADEEVDYLLNQGDGSDGPDDLAALLEAAAVLRERLDAAASSGPELPLDLLTRAFCLSAAERQALIVCLAPHLDSGYEKVYAYANDDVTRRHPTVELILEVIAAGRAEALSLRRFFYQDAALLRHRLLSVVNDSATATASFLSRRLEIDDHVAEFLLGATVGLDPRLHGVAQLSAAAPTADNLGLDRVMQREPATRVYLGGRWELEKEQAVRAACDAAGLGLIVTRTALLQNASGDLFARLLRDARLLNAGILLLGWDERADADADVLTLKQQGDLLQAHPLPVVFSGRRDTPEALPCAVHLLLDFPAPGYAALRQDWSAASLVADQSFDPELLAATFKLGAGGIRDAISMAASIAAARGVDKVTQDDLRAAARLQSQPRLTSMAQRIVPLFSWQDIVLPEDRLDQLHEIATQIVHQHVVYEDWGFGAKVSLGRGVTSLFTGQSGTGKTMAAEIIARDLGLELYKIDLSSLISKYIGETEKNLSRVFDEASDSNCILFFDEADAVFGKRTEVRDSHDRYANVEVSYLLQKMEEYQGVVVLASNLRSNLDEAFLRRMKSIIEFPFPEEEDRLNIWNRMLASAAPIAEDVDLRFMARQFRIAGGNIKNVVLLAAFLAAEDGRPIGMRHLIHATKREFQKLGRLIAESDFAQWYQAARS